MKFRNLALFVLVCAFVLPAYAAGPAKAGKWQTTIEMEMEGMPMKMPPVTNTHCITKEQAESAENCELNIMFAPWSPHAIARRAPVELKTDPPGLHNPSRSMSVNRTPYFCAMASRGS